MDAYASKWSLVVKHAQIKIAETPAQDPETAPFFAREAHVYFLPTSIEGDSLFHVWGE